MFEKIRESRDVDEYISGESFGNCNAYHLLSAEVPELLPGLPPFFMAQESTSILTGEQQLRWCFPFSVK